MKTIAGGFVLALVFFAASAIVWSQAKAADRLAEAHQRLATLQYAADDGATSADQLRASNRWRPGPWQDDERRHRATVTYWLPRYDELTPLLEGIGARQVTDPSLLFAAANAAFRTADYESGDRQEAVERLDHVIQAYAGLLRVDPGHADAAYNYEYVSRLRDGVARSRQRPRRAPDPSAAEVSPDLPPGPTVHGRPGGPPPEIKAEEFKTIIPMKYDEREELDPGAGTIQRRRG